MYLGRHRVRLVYCTEKCRLCRAGVGAAKGMHDAQGSVVQFVVADLELKDTHAARQCECRPTRQPANPPTRQPANPAMSFYPC